MQPPSDWPPTIPIRPRRDWRSWCGDHFVLLVAAILFVVFAVAFLQHAEAGLWRECFVRAALRLQAKQAIHVVEEGPIYAYPPLMAMLTVPLANLPPRPAMCGWFLINVAATIVVFRSAWRLAGGPSLVRMPRIWQLIFWLGMLLSLRFFISPLENQQFDMVIAALLLAGCCRLWRGRDLSAAALLGATAGMKCTPLLLAPYLLWRGKPRAAGLLVLVAVGLNLLPDLFWPQASGRLYLADWGQLALGSQALGVWFSDLIQNQSLAGFFARLWQFGLPLGTTDLTFGALAAREALALRALSYGIGLLLLAATAWRFGQPGRPAPPVVCACGEEVPLGQLQTGAEAAAVFCLMLLLSPMTSKAHYVVLLLPALLIARLVVERRHFWLSALLVPLLICGPLSATNLIGKSLGTLTLAWGLPTCYALVCLVSAWWILAEVRRPAPAEIAEEEPDEVRLLAA